MKLFYSHNLNPRVAVAVARYLLLSGGIRPGKSTAPRRMKQTFRAINPNTLVPVLVEGDRTLWETDAIKAVQVVEHREVRLLADG